MRSTILGPVVVCAMFASGLASAADYGAKGTVATTTTNLSAGFGGATGGKLVVPNAAGTYPLIVASHGFSASADNQVGWAEHFASYGFVVVAPNFPGSFSPDHVKNGEIIKAIVAGLDAADTPAKGKIDKTRIGLEGHSAGGLATTLAAADLRPAATVLFDPVDNGDRGKTAYAKICSPIVALFANPSSCNSNTGWFDFRTTAKGPTTSFRVKGSTHCDGENAPRSLCGFTCGGAADGARQKVYANYATAFFLANLRGDSAAAAELASSALSADGTIAEVSVGGGPSCVSTGGEDAGIASDSGAPIDTGVSIEDVGPSPTDTGTASSDAGEKPVEVVTADDGGCGCTVVGASNRAFAAIAFALALAVVARRNPRRRP